MPGQVSGPLCCQLGALDGHRGPLCSHTRRPQPRPRHLYRCSTGPDAHIWTPNRAGGAEGRWEE